MAKHKFPSISLTVPDRAISSKFSTHRVSEHCTLGNFPKIFPSPKMAAILNFRIFAKNGKTQKEFASISLTENSKCQIERFRQNFRPTGYLRNAIFAIFQKFSPPKKWRPFWIFEFLPKMAKHKFPPISLTVPDRAISSKFSTHRVSEHCTLGNF